MAQYGSLIRDLCEDAMARGVIIVSAAGNDSDEETEVDAQWSSPFNWVAMNNRRSYHSPAFRNVIVVESVGHERQHTPNSNSHGNLSAPGEDILSTVVYTNRNQYRADIYGVQSGTSMAAPQNTALDCGTHVRA